MNTTLAWEGIVSCEATRTGLNAWEPLWTIKLVCLGWKTWCDYLPLYARVFQSVHNATGFLGGEGGVKSRFIPLSRCVSHYRISIEYRTCRTVYIPWENHEKGRVFRSKKRMNECFGHLPCCHAPSRAAFFVSTLWIITRGIDAVPHSSGAKDHVQAVINTHTDLPCQTLNTVTL